MGIRLLRISMTRVKCGQINACERAANQSRLRETRLGALTVLYELDMQVSNFIFRAYVGV